MCCLSTPTISLRSLATLEQGGKDADEEGITNLLMVRLYKRGEMWRWSNSCDQQTGRCRLREYLSNLFEGLREKFEGKTRNGSKEGNYNIHWEEGESFHMFCLLSYSSSSSCCKFSFQFFLLKSRNGKMNGGHPSVLLFLISYSYDKCFFFGWNFMFCFGWLWRMMWRDQIILLKFAWDLTILRAGWQKTE